jgi:hypothetical protein
MWFDSAAALKEDGFEGFVIVGDLMKSRSQVPDVKGIYMVLYENGGIPDFMNPGTGGFLRNEDPNVSIETLGNNWVEGAIVLYVGQAGGVKGCKLSNETLKNRVSTFMSFGRGNKVPHWGGRFIWQIRDRRNLVVCWKSFADEVADPKRIEGQMLREFRARYDGRLPFANIQE